MLSCLLMLLVVVDSVPAWQGRCSMGSTTPAARMGRRAPACSTSIEQEVAGLETMQCCSTLALCTLVPWPCPLPLAKPARLLPISKPTRLSLRHPRCRPVLVLAIAGHPPPPNLSFSPCLQKLAHAHPCFDIMHRPSSQAVGTKSRTMEPSSLAIACKSG